MANANGWGDGSVNNSIGWGQGANNAIGWGKSHLSSWSGETDIDGSNLPSNTVAPAITGTAQEGQTLTCSTGTWTGSPTYTYQWKRNGNNITSATNSTYTLVTADVGQTILCTVTATNFIGSASANSNSVTPTSSTDADAQAFITAASITDPTQQTAINNLVTGLKTDGIWTKMKAIYPFVGGTASQHKFNLKNPLNTNAAFRLIFNGGWTHSANGAQGNGINNFMNTWFNPLTQYSSNLFSAHISYYSRTNNINDCLDFSTNVGGNLYSYTYPDYIGGGYFYGGFNNQIDFSAISNTQGLYTVSMINDSSLFGYVNSTQQGSDTNTYGNTFISDLFTIGGSTAAGIYSPKQYAFATIGIGLTDTDVANLYSRIQAFQTTLGRQV